MKTKRTMISGTGIAVLGVSLALVLTLPASSADPKKKHKGIVQDWTNHHIIFSHPGTKEEAIQKGEYERWLKIVNNPRYIMQQELRSRTAGAPAMPSEAPVFDAIPELDAVGDDGLTPEQRQEAQVERGGMAHVGLTRAPQSVASSAEAQAKKKNPPPPKNRIKKDWSEDLGSGATVGLGDYPATYTTGGTSCSDFAVYNTGLPGSSTQASIVAFNNLYSSCDGGTPTVLWAYNTGGTITNAVVMNTDGIQVAFEQSVGGVATLSILRTTAGGSITMPVTPTAEPTSGYVGCTAPCMTSITFLSSPTDTYSFPYYDPTDDEIFVGDDAGALHLFYNIFNEFGTNSAPLEIGNQISSPYWPRQVTSASGVAALGSPVYDPTSGNVFIGDYILNPYDYCEPSATDSAYSCGYLYSVPLTPASPQTVYKSGQLDYNVGLLDSPIVDSTSGYVYAFVGDDGTTNCSSGPCAAVFQFSTSFTSGSGAEAAVGPGYEFMMSGTFDNTYYTSESPGASGNLYVVGNTGAANNTLYQIPITANSMGTPVAGPVVSTSYSNGLESAGLQITEFFNTAGTTPHDYIFLSVLSYGYGNGSCSGQSATIGCLLAYDVTTATVTPISSSSNPTGALPESGGTSGIIVDNGSAGASNIYFSTLLNQSCTGPGVTGTGGCAVQTLQSAP